MLSRRSNWGQIDSFHPNLPSARIGDETTLARIVHECTHAARILSKPSCLGIRFNLVVWDQEAVAAVVEFLGPGRVSVSENGLNANRMDSVCGDDKVGNDNLAGFLESYGWNVGIL